MTMALVQFCCCWSSLRSGCYASALYTMVYFTVTITMVTIFGVAEGDPEAAGFGEQHQQQTTTTTTVATNQAEDPHTLWILNICVVTLSALGLISTFLLLYGLAKDRRGFLVPWIAVVTCTTAVDLIYAIYLLIHVLRYLMRQESLNPISAMVFTGDFVLVVINVYCILCVVSQYQELDKNHQSARRQIVGLAVTEDLYDTNQQPLESIKLSEVIGPDHLRAQQLDAVCAEGLWIDCAHNKDSKATARIDVDDDDEDDELPSNSQRRVTFKCRATVGSCKNGKVLETFPLVCGVCL